MTIPALPAFYDMPCTEKGDVFSADFYLYNDQTFQVLNYDTFSLNSTLSTYVSDGKTTMYTIPPPLAGQLVIIGLNPPSLKTAQIAAIVATSPQVVPYGTIFYDNQIDKLYVFLQAGLQQIQSV